MACRNRNCRNSACRNNACRNSACRNSACRNRNCLLSPISGLGGPIWGMGRHHSSTACNLPHYKSPTALLDMHHLTCGISSKGSSFRQPHFVHCPPGSPHPAHRPITSSQSPPSLSPSITPGHFTTDLKLISITNPFLHSHFYSFQTAFTVTDLNL